MFITVYIRPTTVSGLPSGAAALEGMIGYVTDATSTSAGSVVAGSGSNAVMVSYNGTNWLVGGGDVAPTVPVGANPTATAGPSAVNGSAATFMRSDGAPAVQVGSGSQQGIVQVDGTTITASAGVITAALPVGANPTATGADTAVNGSATTFMRSDAAPAIQKASASVFGLVKVDGGTITASGGVITAPLGVPKATSANFSVSNGYQLNIENRLTLTSTQEASFLGTSNLILTDDTTPVLVGSPKSNISFTLPTDRFLGVQGELTLNGSQRATLQGNSNLIMYDDFGTRSRIVLH